MMVVLTCGVGVHIYDGACGSSDSVGEDSEGDTVVVFVEECSDGGGG